VVLFTLYLKEDVDANGRVKDGVEGGKPFELMDETTRELHEKKKNGLEVQGIQEGMDKVKLGGEKESQKWTAPETSEDDVD
jgi:hypothetical protein